MSNPFNKLKVQRDEEDVEVKAEVKVKGGPLFPDADKTKKKVKPEKKEEKVEQSHNDHNDTEGFEVVGKAKKPFISRADEDTTEKVLDQKPGKKEPSSHFPKQNRGDKVFRSNGKQRVFDRHESGTGYDKKVKKDGFGGKHTWEGSKKYDYDDTDYYFNKALNPKAPKEVKEEPLKEEVEEIVQEKEVTPTEVKVEGESEVKTEVKEGEGEKTEKKWRGKKGKKDETEEVDEKNKLVIPENAISLSDYKKNVKTATEVKTTTKIEVDLEPVEKKDESEIQVEGKKTGKKTKKVKELDAKEIELNKLIGASLKIEESNKGYRGGYKK